MTGDDAVKCESLDSSKAFFDPIIGMAVRHVRSPAVDKVTGANDSFFGEENNGVAVGVASAEEEDLDGTVPTVEDEAFFRLTLSVYSTT